MTSTDTRVVIDRYFDLMGRGEDFATCYAEDVRWMTFDGGTRVVGPTEVRDYLVGLHGNMPDSPDPAESCMRMGPPYVAGRPPAPIRAVQAPIAIAVLRCLRRREMA